MLLSLANICALSESHEGVGGGGGGGGGIAKINYVISKTCDGMSCWLALTYALFRLGRP